MIRTATAAAIGAALCLGAGANAELLVWDFDISEDQIKNGAEPWQDVQECDCPGICTDMYFFLEGRLCCLAHNRGVHLRLLGLS